MTAGEFLARLDQVPHLFELARARDDLRRYQVQEALRRQCRREGRAFLYSMPMRRLYTCPVCGKQGTDILHVLEDPRRNCKTTFFEGTLHKAQAHDTPPEKELSSFLEACREQLQ